MHPNFDEAMMHGISFLRELPHRREEVLEARARLERFRETHPGIRADLLVDQPPASRRADYDLLLGHPDGGTVALSWLADEGVPWAVQYADHWAANYVLTVNARELTIQQALLFLKLTGDREPDLMTELVEQQVIALAIEEDPPPVSNEELQAAANEFRSASDLLSAEATHRWLEELGFSMGQFQERLRGVVQMRKLKERITADRVEPYFEAHRESFDLVQFFRVETPTEVVASNLAAAAREQGLLAATQAQTASTGGGDLKGSLISRHAHELPSALAAASPGAVVGPVAEGRRHWVTEVFSRQPAQLDAQIRAAIQEKLFREWIAKRREQAAVRWHWM
jgi:putative peptide maturation system protein